MSFAAAAFLAGLVTLALPWWLHRLERNDPRTRLVSSLLLMRAAETPRERQRTLRYRGLLALRLLLLAALSFAFAQPLLERLGGAPAGAVVAPRVLVIDTSLSMAAVAERARDRALTLIDALPAGAQGVVLGVAAELTLLAGPTSDKAVLAAAVAGAEPTATRLAFDGLLGRTATRLAGLTERVPEVHLISDFQASAMPDRFNALVAGNELAVTLHPIGDEADNWQLSGALSESQLVVSVRSHAAVPRRVTLTVEDADAELERRTLEVGAGASRRVAVTVPAASGTDRWLRARIDSADAIAADDVVNLVVPGAAVVDLPIYRAPGAEHQSDYLRAAVRAAAPRFRPGPASLDGPVAVAIDGGGLAAAERRRLERHLAGGGGVLVSVGAGTRRAGVLPFDGPTLANLDAAAPPRGVIRVDSAHPALGDAADWRDVRVYRHLSADATPGRVLVALDDGTPLLIEYPSAAGRVLTLTTALDPQWSSLVTDPVFVRLIAEALDYLAQDALPIAAIAGEPLALTAANAQLFDAAGARLLSLGDSAARRSVRLDRPGIYTLRTPNRQRLLAVNPDPRESQTEAADPALLARWQAAVQARPVAVPAPAATTRSTWPLAPWLLVVLLGLAFLEPMVANLGRAERRA